MVDDRAVRYPDPQGAEDAAQFVALLIELRAWSGQVSLRRLRTLGGSVTSASGAVVDALPPTTVSDILAGKRLPALPRRAFVEAFVTACLSAHGCTTEEIEPMLASWVSAWQTLTLRPATPQPSAQPPEPPEPPASAAGETVGAPTHPAGTRRARYARRPVGIVLAVLAVAAASAGVVELNGHSARHANRGPVTAHGRSVAKRLPVAMPVAGSYRIQVAATGLCLSERPGGSASGIVFETGCARTFPSRGLEPQADGTYRLTTLHPVYGPGCMGVRRNSTVVGATVEDDFCNDGDGVAFRLVPVTRPTPGFAIVSAGDDLCIGIQLDPKLAVGDPDDPVPVGVNWAPARQLRCDPSAATQVFRFLRQP